MKFNIITFLIFVLAFSNVRGNDFYPEKQATKIVKSFLQDKTLTLSNRLVIESASGADNLIILYRINKPGSDEKSLAVFTQAKGRYEMFDYLLIVANNFVIKQVKIVKYRSEHGGEITSKKWLTQFENYSTGELKYGKDISAISGATLSAKSITNNIPIVINAIKQTISQ